MQAKVMREDGAMVYLLVFDEGEEVIETLTAFAKDRSIAGAHFSALGAFREAKLAWFDCDTREYVPIVVDEQVEVASLVGNVAVFDEEIRVHAHAVLGRRDGSTVAGHVVNGRVRPTLEVFLVDEPSTLARTIDERVGLPLLDVAAG
jgi:predicted DNA-binding protein with PD1-like motif